MTTTKYCDKILLLSQNKHNIFKQSFVV